MAFFVGLIGFYHFNLVGEVYPAEFILVAFIPFLWSKRSGVLRDRMVKWIVGLGLLWFLGQVATDVYRSTPEPDLLRGWAAISLFVIEFVGLFLLVGGNERRLRIFLAGLAIGFILQPTVLPSEYSEADPWKFGYGLPLVWLFLVLMSSFGGRHIKYSLWWIGTLVGFGVFSFYMHYRSLAAIAILAAVFIYLRGTPFGRIAKKNIRAPNLIMLVFAFFAVGWGVAKMYEYSITEGWADEKGTRKYESQGAGEYGFLLGGRIEILASGPAVIDSPILGHGSWAKNMEYRYNLLAIRDLGYDVDEHALRYAINSSELIPTHSHFMQAWVWAGILGAVFWVGVLVVVFRSAVMTYRQPSRLFVLVMFFSIISVWDFAFSPFGSTMRLEWAGRLVLFIVSYQISSRWAHAQ